MISHSSVTRLLIAAKVAPVKEKFKRTMLELEKALKKNFELVGWSNLKELCNGPYALTDPSL